MRGIARLQVVLFVFLLTVPVMTLAAGLPAEPPRGGDPTALQFEGSGPWVVRVPLETRGTIRALAEWADVWSVYPTKGYAVVQIDRADVERLIAEGYRPTLDAERTGLLQRAGQAPENQTSGIPGYACYRTVEETYADAAALAATHPGLVTWTDVGDSWERTQNPANGYDLNVLRLTQSAVGGPKPKLFASCSIHAREYATAELCTRFAERLVAGYGVDPDITWLLDEHEVHLLLVANPDGRKRAETGLSWRKNTDNNYCSNSNSRGVDLNRNFTFQWGCCGGSSGSECSTTYRGPAPGSEPEIQALEAYVSSIFPDQRPADLTTPAPADATGIAIDIHSYGDLVLWAWGFDSAPAPNSTALTTLGRKLAYFNNYLPQQAIDLYPTDGTSNDFFYGDLGVAGLVFELGTAFFESCTYFEFNILEQNVASLLYAAKAARTPYLTPAGPEALGVAVAPQTFEAGDQVLLSATLNDARFGTRGGTEPSQAVVAAEVYVDVPPWQAGATPLSMTAGDGLFDSAVEAAEATIDTTGFAPGRYTLFVRGVDAAGNWGTVSATFLYLVDPATAPVIEGTVSDQSSLAPLAATVRAGGFETTTDAGGFYSLRVPAGSYDVTAISTGYQSSTAEGVVAVDSQTALQGFDLPPFAGLWTDDAEAGNPGWSVQAPWAISSEASFSPSRAWSDSPGTLYANNVNASLTSPVLDLQGYGGTTLSFRQRYDLEQGFDFGRVEISTDGGSEWSEVAVFTGLRTASWELVELQLPALDGQAQARFRFRLDSDESVQRNGWFIDDVLLAGVFSGNNLPALTITAPADGAAFDVGDPITFTGIASDLEDGDLSGSIAWSSDLDGALGAGASLQTSTLSEGPHTITAAVVDSGGAGASDAISVRVGGCSAEVDFEAGAAGWVNSPASTCATGAFVVATPTEVVNSGVVTQLAGDHTTGTGNAYFSAINTAAGTDDVDSGVCIVESPIYAVTKASEVSIWYFHGQRDAGDDPTGDFFLLEMSTDGGAGWSPLASFGDVTVNAAWTEATASVAAGSNVQFRLQVADGTAAGDLIEAGLDDLAICPAEPACVTDPDCDDGLFCNGAESCNAGSCQAATPVACDDGVSCTTGACNEASDACDFTPNNALCDNGLFCDGAESCDAVLGCQAAAPVDCTDGIACTADACNEASDACDHTPNDALCDNGIFCDGAERCDAVLACQPGSEPCQGLFCDEPTTACVQCFDNSDCDDGLFCNGAESCFGGSCLTGSDPCPGQACDEGGDFCIAGPQAQLEWGTVSAGTAPVTVNLTKSYLSPVVVTAVRYSANTTPVVARIDNLTATSFDLRLQLPSGGSAAVETVSYLVVEEGVWTVNGVKIEAQTYTSTVTDDNNSWTGESQSYGQAYTAPVVLGQVMSSNDPAWSVFWDQGASRTSPPSSTALVTGKTVCEDPNDSRADETVGIVVFETAHGSLGGIELESALGPDSVGGITNSPPYTYTFATPFASAPTVPLVAMAGMDGGNGGWAYLFGASAPTTTAFNLAVDEDQLKDTERNHTPEQVGYVVFASPGAYP